MFPSEYSFATPWLLGAGNLTRDHDFSPGSSSIMSKSDFFSHGSSSNRVNNDGDFESSFGNDDEINENGACKLEGSEVRIDLTDDLLHMVCISWIYAYFLAHLFYSLNFLFTWSYFIIGIRFSLSWITSIFVELL